MTRIKVKIIDHDGATKKPGLLDCLGQADAYVNRIIESKNAFFLVVDHVNMDKILSEDVRQQFQSYRTCGR